MKTRATTGAVALFAMVVGAFWGCSHSQPPAVETGNVPVVTPGASAQEPTAAASSPGQAQSSAAAPASPQPGDIALPPGSASAWNNAQSDGKKPNIDRGLGDYQQIIMANRDKFRACYETSLGAHPGIKGKAVLKFVLASDGSVKEAGLDRAASDIVVADLEACMTKTLKSLAFPPSKRGMESTVSYPFTFTPGARSANSARM